ncbi:MAG: ATP-binding protein [Candidatus Anammoxibacter sp.]
MYFQRKIEERLLTHLHDDKILVLIGARQSGKTTLLKKIKSVLDEKGETTFFINLENPKFLSKLDEDYENLFTITGNIETKKAYVFIDEVQYLKDPSNFLKYIFDEYKSKIKLIVSGSSAFYIDQKFKDSLAGRKRLYELKLLDFREFLHFKGYDDLKKIFVENNLPVKREIPSIYLDKIRHLFNEFAMFGAYPEVVLERSEEEKRNLLEELFSSYMAKDIEHEGVKNKTKFLSLMRILCEQVGSLLNSAELANILGISITSIENYIYILEKSFQIRRIRPFHNNARKELTKMPKFYFLDVGIRNIILDDFTSLQDRIDRGQYFENIVFKLLNDKMDVKTINFWRTQEKHEVDFIINRKIAIETKFNAKAFKKNKYKKFITNYKNIPLYMLSYQDDENATLSIFDVI